MERIVKKPKNLLRKEILFSRIKRKILKHTLLVRVGAIALFLAGIYLVFFLGGLILGNLGFSNYFKLASNFLFTPESEALSFGGRTNFLILGKGGEIHETPDLTDTLIFVSISKKPPAITLISLPRDIWITELRAKLNSAYFWGKQKEKGGGLILAKSMVEKIVGQPVHYGVVIDFSGFKELIDVLGGIEVEIERSFVDEKFPLPGKENDLCQGDPEYKCRYETIEFKKGLEVMDGERALKFVRSRNAEGEEGTDLARAARQEKVVAALKDKLLSSKTLFSLKKLKGIRKLIAEAVETDIDVNAQAVLSRQVFKARNNLKSYVLPEDLLVNPPKSYLYDNLYVFIPKKDNWEDVHKWVRSVL